jgi:hypothetical protein
MKPQQQHKLTPEQQRIACAEELKKTGVKLPTFIDDDGCEQERMPDPLTSLDDCLLLDKMAQNNAVGFGLRRIAGKWEAIFFRADSGAAWTNERVDCPNAAIVEAFLRWRGRWAE